VRKRRSPKQNAPSNERYARFCRFFSELLECDVRSTLDSVEKVFLGRRQKFSGLLMRFARGDMRDHIVSHKNDHGALYERYGVLQWWSRLKISFCEIFGVVQFSTFATLSPRKQTSSAEPAMFE